jgi:hypothetical protein
MTTVMDDAYFAEVKRRELGLCAVIGRHLGSNTVDDFADASGVVLIMTLYGGSFDAMNRRAEMEKLQRVRRAAQEFVKAWVSLHPDVLATIINSSVGFGAKRRDPDIPFDPAITAWRAFWDAVPELDGLIEHALSNAKACIDAAPEMGRRNIRAVNVVDELREIWAKRKGAPAPTNITEAGPFADFLIDAFDALGLEGNPRAAMDSWREYRAKYPKND